MATNPKERKYVGTGNVEIVCTTMYPMRAWRTEWRSQCSRQVCGGHLLFRPVGEVSSPTFSSRKFLRDKGILEGLDFELMQP
jgi:hypothetical protein